MTDSAVMKNYTRVIATSMNQIKRNDVLTNVSTTFLIVLTIATIAYAVAAPPQTGDIAHRNEPPLSSSGGMLHVLGTDPLGRDLLGRLLDGAQVTLLVAVLSVIFSGIIGVTAGLLAGYFRGWVETVVMRLVDLQMSLPGLLIALLVLYVLGPSVLNVVLVLSLTRWMVYARMARALTLSLANEAYVEAAQSLGVSRIRILVRHVVPNMMAPIAVLATLEMAIVMLIEASLGFLGLGVQPPDTSWGLMVAEGRQYIITAWWLVVFPGLAIMLTALSINIVATSLREKLRLDDISQPAQTAK